MDQLAELRKRASCGEPDAQLALGVRFLTGDGLPLDAAEGGHLVDLAFRGGSADAAALLATMEAMGAARPQSWSKAFDCLRIAAERGSGRARGQLAVLTKDPALGAEWARGEPFAQDLWQRLRAPLDPAVLLAARAARPLCENPRIRVVEGFAAAAECDWAMGVARGNLRAATVYDAANAGPATDPNRTNRAVELNLIRMDVVMQVLRARISAVTRVPVPVFEPVQILHYSVGQEFKPHYDYLSEGEGAEAGQLQRYGQRIATFLLYLNEGFEGGETDFPAIGLRHKGRRGDGLFFANVDRSGAADPLTLHAGRAPTSGEKWILSQWIRDRSPA